MSSERQAFPLWQPIATAPTDGTEIIVGWEGRMVSGGFWFSRRQAWVTPHGHYIRAASPTHWLPLPDPPAASEPQSPAEVMRAHLSEFGK